MSNKEPLLSLETMKKRTKDFYQLHGIAIKYDEFALAVRSLTMPQYSKEYNDKGGQELGDHTALATVGDAFIASYLMKKCYTDESTADSLTKNKKPAKNINLKLVGERYKGYLFARNNDLKPDNKKSYATAFEAVVGFIALKHEDQLQRFLDEEMRDIT